MNALSTFVDRLFFAGTCVLGWIIFPMLITAGLIALAGYALLAELLATTAHRLGRPIHP